MKQSEKNPGESVGRGDGDAVGAFDHLVLGRVLHRVHRLHRVEQLLRLEEQQRRERPSLRPTRAHLAALVLLLVLRVHHNNLRERARELTLRPVQRLPAVRDGHPARRGVDAGFLAPAAAEHGAGIPRVRQLDVLRRMRGAPRLSERAVRRARAIHREPKPALLHPRRGHITGVARKVRAPRDVLFLWGASLRRSRVVVCRRRRAKSRIQKSKSRIRSPPSLSLLRPRRRGEHVEPVTAPMLPPVAPRLRIVVVWDERAAAERGGSTEGFNRGLKRVLILGDAHVPHGVVGDVRAEPVLFRDSGRGGLKGRRGVSAGVGGDLARSDDGFSRLSIRGDGWSRSERGFAEPGSSGRVRAHLIVQVGRVQRELLERGGERRAALTRVALEGFRHCHDLPFTKYVKMVRDLGTRFPLCQDAQPEARPHDVRASPARSRTTPSI
mmetsp:Transcript_10247/g.44541  ORF Transcript_10247/g.44541 Transcript_10247/m.44541 type:complete len:439 (+) Transcript_10247:3426-4742(+)